MRGLGLAERQVEQKRLAARKKRLEKERQASIDAALSPATPGGPGTPGTPATAASIASEARLTKKEREKQAKQVHQTDEVMRQQANQTAALALGGRSKYSWMTAAAPAAPSTGFGTGVGAGKLAGARAASSVGLPTQKEEDRHLRSKDAWKNLGNFREDGPGGKGVQVRDVVVVLERDSGLEGKSLTKAYTKMRAEKQESK
jgi:Transcription initiation factor TFIID component TAF4 family